MDAASDLGAWSKHCENDPVKPETTKVYAPDHVFPNNHNDNQGNWQWFPRILGPDQDAHFFYTRYHLSALQSCALFYQPIFSLFLHLNSAKHNLVIKWCRTLKTI